MKTITYTTVQRAEMAPDLYAGENCDEAMPQWKVTVMGEGEEELDGALELDPAHFPPGTMVLIQVPVCPDCELDAEYAEDGICECGFNWNEWRDAQYG